MSVELKAGGRFRSTVCETEVVVVRAPAHAVDLRCGGHPMVPASAGGTSELGAPEEALADGTTVGKRYVDGDGDLEVLCTKAGVGSLSMGAEPLDLKDAKPLPASD
jgi:hypothetical protein